MKERVAVNLPQLVPYDAVSASPVLIDRTDGHLSWSSVYKRSTRQIIFHRIFSWIRRTVCECHHIAKWSFPPVWELNQIFLQLNCSRHKWSAVPSCASQRVAAPALCSGPNSPICQRCQEVQTQSHDWANFPQSLIQTTILKLPPIARLWGRGQINALCTWQDFRLLWRAYHTLPQSLHLRQSRLSSLSLLL